MRQRASFFLIALGCAAFLYLTSGFPFGWALTGLSTLKVIAVLLGLFMLYCAFGPEPKPGND